MKAMGYRPFRDCRGRDGSASSVITPLRELSVVGGPGRITTIGGMDGCERGQGGTAGHGTFIGRSNLFVFINPTKRDPLTSLLLAVATSRRTVCSNGTVPNLSKPTGGILRGLRLAEERVTWPGPSSVSKAPTARSGCWPPWAIAPAGWRARGDAGFDPTGVPEGQVLGTGTHDEDPEYGVPTREASITSGVLGRTRWQQTWVGTFGFFERRESSRDVVSSGSVALLVQLSVGVENHDERVRI